MIAVLDDHPAPLISILSEAGYSVAAIASLAELAGPERNPEPDCVLLDLDCPAVDESSFQNYLLARRVAPPIIITTRHAAAPLFAFRAAEAGILAALRKPIQHDDLLTAVRNLVSQHQRACRHREEAAKYRARFLSLTAREREVFQFVVSGNLNKQIAAQLGLAEKTIKVHRGNLMRKMQVVSVAALVNIALKLQEAAELTGFPSNFLT